MSENQRGDHEKQRPLDSDESDNIIVTIGDNVTGVVVGKDITQAPIPTSGDRYSLREWWHGVVRDHGRYSCYAIFLLLPSDEEALRYLINFGKELDLISGENCAVIALGRTEVRRSGFDKRVWRAIIEGQATEGYSIKVAQLFDITFDKFPCLVVFQDIRSPNHVVVTLKGMTTQEIVETMRSVFSIIQDAVINNDNPLNAIEKRRNSEALSRKGKTIVSELHTLIGKTFETAVEAWIKASIK